METTKMQNIIEVAPGVFFRLGDISRGQANGGYIVCKDHVVAIEAPNVECAQTMEEEVKNLTNKPIKYLVITHGHWDHDLGLPHFVERGVTVICHETLRAKYQSEVHSGEYIGVTDKVTFSDGIQTIEFFTLGRVHSKTDLFTFLPNKGVIFTGDSVVNMPGTLWMGECDIWNWISSLDKMDCLQLRTVCPGHGPSDTPNVLNRLRRYLTSLRDEVAYQISQGRSFDKTLETVNVESKEEWADNAQRFREHLESVYNQLTSEIVIERRGLIPSALALIGDHYHPPAYIQPALNMIFEKIGMPVEYIYDVTKLNSTALENGSLLVILRDGMLWPNSDREMSFWLTEEQERAISNFVFRGGGFLAMHNSTALKALDDRPSIYRNLLGASYNGHGPGDEKFYVRVVNRDHPVTQGVNDYVAIDERHTPILHSNDVTIITEAFSNGQRSVNGYVKDHGKGRVCYLANGHNFDVLTNPEMQKLMLNAVLWCIKRI